MTDFIESFATQQLLPPWEAEKVQSWGFVVRMTERRIRDYLDTYFNGAYPDRAPYHYTPVPDAHFGLLSAVHFGRVASRNKRTASRLGDGKEAWDHLQHTEVYLVFPALRYPVNADNLLAGEPTLVWVEPFIFSDNDSVVFSSREIWGSDMYLGTITRQVGLPRHQLHLDLGTWGTRQFTPRSKAEMVSVLHIRTGGDSPIGLGEIFKQNPHLQPFASILVSSGGFAGEAPDGVPPSPYAGGDELNNLKQFRDCFDMSAAIYRAIVASKTTHTEIKNINLFDTSKVEIAFMWSDGVRQLLTTMFDVEGPNEPGPPPDHGQAAKDGPVTTPDPSFVGPPPAHFPKPTKNTPNVMDWQMDRVVLKAELAFSFRSKARFEVAGTIHSYGQTPD